MDDMDIFFLGALFDKDMRVIRLHDVDFIIGERLDQVPDQHRSTTFQYVGYLKLFMSMVMIIEVATKILLHIEGPHT